MAHTNDNESRSLMMQHSEETRNLHESTNFPEVVPVENLKDNTIRHDDAWYRRPVQPFSPLQQSNSSGNSPYTTTSTPHPQATEYSDGTSIGVRGFRKTSRKNFALLVALFTFLLTALALSTGLGIPLSKCRNRLRSNNYSPMAPHKINTLKKSGFCDANGKLTRDSVYTAAPNSSFDLHCGVIFLEGLAAFDPTTNVSTSSGTVKNIVAIVSYSVADCIQACASMNQLADDDTHDSPRCQSMTFISEMKNSVDLYRGNCFLKNATVADLSQAGLAKGAVSAEVKRLRSEI